MPTFRPRRIANKEAWWELPDLSAGWPANIEGAMIHCARMEKKREKKGCAFNEYGSEGPISGGDSFKANNLEEALQLMGKRMRMEDIRCNKGVIEQFMQLDEAFWLQVHKRVQDPMGWVNGQATSVNLAAEDKPELDDWHGADPGQEEALLANAKKTTRQDKGGGTQPQPRPKRTRET